MRVLHASIDERTHSSMTRFQPFSLAHILTVIALALAIAAVVAAGRSAQRDGTERRFHRIMGWIILAFWIIYHAYSTLTTGFQWTSSLPLQVCDVTALAAAFTFLSNHRLAQTMAYFWGIALSSQGVITPDLSGGPTTIDFWGFWLYHGFVVGTGIYAVAARGYRPTWRDFGIAAGIGLLYAALMFALDVVSGANYGYLGRPGSSQPSLLDVMGPWPQRVPIMVGLAIAAMAMLQVPWSIGSRRRKRSLQP